MATITVDIDFCKGCERCVDACPVDIIEMATEVNAKGYLPAVLVDEGKCTGCAVCALVCPDVAIEVYVEPNERKRPPRASPEAANRRGPGPWAKYS